MSPAVTHLIAALALILLLSLVLIRAFLMKREGIRAICFGNLDRKDFFIPPFALFYFYTVFAAAWGWPLASRQIFFQSFLASWIGALLCLGGLALLGWSLVSFGRSFRVGIDTAKPGRLVTNGIFALSRNPIYVAFAAVLIGNFLFFPIGFSCST